MARIFFFAFLFFFSNGTWAQQKPEAYALLAKPTRVQFAWQEQERILFVALDPATWEGREYDDHSIPLSRINPKKLNTDQWCMAAKAWGAKEILFVAKHTGGFCWWSTHTTDYGIRNTAWKNGKGDVLKELSASCKKFGLNLGMYVSPADESWGVGIGSGGRTKDPSKQEGYNKVYRQQLKEVLTRYGRISEIWFDGSCVIDVSDIVHTYAKYAVIFQSPQASIRWVGNEEGVAPYPAWNSLDSASLITGVATAAQGYPDGNAWAPLECDLPLYNHFWFWSKENEEKRRTLNELMEVYSKSVGRGAVMLLNSTPDTTGLIPAGDMVLYMALGKEINRRFAHPIATTSDNTKGLTEIDLKTPTEINQIVIMEDYRAGERIRGYVVEGLVNNQWKQLCSGSSIGRKRIQYFENTKVVKVRLKITNVVHKPLIRLFSIYKTTQLPSEELVTDGQINDWRYLHTWVPSMFKDGRATITLNLSTFITTPGQYEVKFEKSSGKDSFKIVNASLFYEGEPALPAYLTQKGNLFYINRTAQVTPESSSLLRVVFDSPGNADCSGNIFIRKLSAD
ncbi:MAG: alpha-L-fucosidase [Bacteroidetes bacterium]|nr:alpha-L-fucosidase [Bacteroidota bacterium]